MFDDNESLKNRIMKVGFHNIAIEAIPSFEKFKNEYGMQLIHFILNNCK